MTTENPPGAASQCQSARVVVWAFLFRYEPIPDHVVESVSTKKVHQVVWDRWKRRLCVAFLGREELACTADELKTAASHLEIDEVKAHLQTQIPNVGYIERILQTEKNTVVEGWAADPAAKSPAVAVHIFVAGEEVAVESPNVPRPDVATALSAASNLFGFHTVVAVGPTSDVQVFAQLHDGSFVELMKLTPH